MASGYSSPIIFCNLHRHRVRPRLEAYRSARIQACKLRKASVLCRSGMMLGARHSQTPAIGIRPSTACRCGNLFRCSALAGCNCDGHDDNERRFKNKIAYAIKSEARRCWKHPRASNHNDHARIEMADVKLERQDFYVYVLFRPDTAEPFYVGKGCGRRIRRSANDKNNVHKSRIVSQAKERGLDIPVVMVAHGLSEPVAFEYESAWITAIGREPSGPLVNRMDGGANPPSSCGRKLKAETIEKMRRAAKGRRPSPQCIAAVKSSQTGRKRSKQQIEKQRIALKSVIRTPEWYAKVSASLKGRRPSESTREAHQAWCNNIRRKPKICAECSKQFAPKRASTIHCSKRCSGRATARNRGFTCQ